VIDKVKREHRDIPRFEEENPKMRIPASLCVTKESVEYFRVALCNQLVYN
jgi:hypothetical protein